MKNCIENQQVGDKYLNVLEHAKNVVKTNDVMVTWLGYWVMKEMVERVPGATYKESRTLSIDDAMDVDGHHIEVAFAHPDLSGWMRAHEANAANGGR